MTRSIPLPQKRLLTRREAAECAGVSPETFDAMARRGDMPQPVNLGEGPVWDRHKIEAQIGWVYVGEIEGYVKIGWSRNISARFRDLQAGIPHELYLTHYFNGSQGLERSLHRRFEEYRERGEWFRAEGKLLEWIEEGCPL